MSYDPSTFTLFSTYRPFRAAARAARGAQYSPDWSLVNALKYLNEAKVQCLSCFFFGPVFGGLKAPDEPSVG
jgi:hypothetical protein